MAARAQQRPGATSQEGGGMKWQTAQHPWGTGRTMHTAGPFTITAWIDEGPEGGEFIRYDLKDGGYLQGEFRSAAAAKRHAAKLVTSGLGAIDRHSIYALGFRVHA